MKIGPTNQWVARAVERAGGQAELARLISKELRRVVDRAAVNKMTIAKRRLAADEMLAMEAVTGLPVPSPHVPALVRIVDWVTAGTLAEPNSQIPESDAPPLPISGLAPGDYFALRVEGNSMDRLCPEGAVIIVNRAAKAKDPPIPGKPYVFNVNGLTTFKLWHSNPDYLEPYSWDPSHKPKFIKKSSELTVVGRVVRSIMDFA